MRKPDYFFFKPLSTIGWIMLTIILFATVGISWSMLGIYVAALLIENSNAITYTWWTNEGR